MALAEATHLPSSISNCWREHALSTESDDDDMEGANFISPSYFDHEEEADMATMNGDDDTQQEYHHHNQQ